MKIVYYLIVLLICLSNLKSQSIFDDLRTNRYDYIYDNCIEEGVYPPPECFTMRLKKWEKHLDSVVIVLKSKLLDNKFKKEHDLFVLNQKLWEQYYNSQDKYDQEFLWNTWWGAGGHRGMKDRIEALLIERCLFIEDDIERLENAIENNKKTKD